MSSVIALNYISQKKRWWRKRKALLKTIPCLQSEIKQLEAKINKGNCTVLLFDDGESSMMLSPRKTGVFIDLVYSPFPNALVFYLRDFKQLMEKVGYTAVYTSATTPSRKRLFKRLGFTQDTAWPNLLKLEL